MPWDGVGGGVEGSTVSGPGAFGLPLIFPLTTSAKRLSPPQAGMAGAATMEPDLGVASVLWSAIAFGPTGVSLFAANVEATVLAVMLLCVLTGVLVAALMDVSTAGSGGKEEACKSKAVNAAAAVA